MRECGECTECCRLMGVPEIGKLPDHDCPHCIVKGGCAIYATRPRPCRVFMCGWLASDQDTAKAAGLRVLDNPTNNQWRLPSSMRPDRSHVVLTFEGDNLVLVVDPRFPRAWMTPRLRPLLDEWLTQRQHCIVQHSERRFLLVGLKDRRGKLVKTRIPLERVEVDGKNHWRAVSTPAVNVA